jgi:glutathione S-transferase
VKLYYSVASPYSRKARVTAHEKGLADRIELVPVETANPEPDFLASNPFGKIPALVADDGAVIIESATIAEYLDGIGEGPSLAGPDRADVARRAAFGQAMIDAAYSMVIEGRRPADKQMPETIEKRKKSLERAVPGCEVAPGRFDLGDIALACALGYMDFRLPQLDWRAVNPALAAWYEDVKKRPSMQATAPN